MSKPNPKLFNTMLNDGSIHMRAQADQYKKTKKNMIKLFQMFSILLTHGEIFYQMLIIKEIAGPVGLIVQQALLMIDYVS